MKTLSSYLLRKVISCWLGSLLSFGVIVVCAAAFKQLRDGLLLTDVFRLLPLILPTVMVQIIPVSIAMGASGAFSLLEADGEITALTSSGWPLKALLWRTTLIAFGGALLMLILMWWVIPGSKGRLKMAVAESLPRIVLADLKRGVPRILPGGEVLSVGGVAENQALQEVVILWDNPQGSHVVKAEQAFLEHNQEQGRFEAVLVDATHHFVPDAKETHQDGLESFSQKAARFPMTLAFDDSRSQRQHVEDMSYQELKAAEQSGVGHGEGMQRAARIEHVMRWAIPWGTWFLALASALAGLLWPTNNRLGAILPGMLLYFIVFLPGIAWIKSWGSQSLLAWPCLFIPAAMAGVMAIGLRLILSRKGF